MAGIVVAGAGAIGASVAYHLALLGARDVILCDRGDVASGSTGRAMGGVRQQFSTAAEVALAQASIRFFEELGEPLFERVGYLFLATSADGLAELEARAELQRSLGVPVERVDASEVGGLAVDDVLRAVVCRQDGVADPTGVTRELVRRAVALGVELRERTDARALEWGTLVVACGPWSRELGEAVGVDLPIRPLCRQLVDTEPIAAVPERLPMVVEAETGFHFRRTPTGGLRLAMGEAKPRWGWETGVDEALVADWLERLARRFPAAVGRVAERVYAACGFSGHGFMQSPAVGRAVAQELLEGGSELDLSPYRLERFGSDVSFPETLVL